MNNDIEDLAKKQIDESIKIDTSESQGHFAWIPLMISIAISLAVFVKLTDKTDTTTAILAMFLANMVVSSFIVYGANAITVLFRTILVAVLGTYAIYGITDLLNLPESVQLFVYAIFIFSLGYPFYTLIFNTIKECLKQSTFSKIMGTITILGSIAVVIVFFAILSKGSISNNKEKDLITVNGVKYDKEWRKNYVNDASNRNVPDASKFENATIHSSSSEIKIGECFWTSANVVGIENHQKTFLTYDLPTMIVDYAVGKKAKAITYGLYREKVIDGKYYDVRDGYDVVYLHYALLNMNPDNNINQQKLSSNFDLELIADDKSFQTKYYTMSGKEVRPKIVALGSFEGKVIERDYIDQQLIEYDEATKNHVYDGFIILYIPYEYRDYTLKMTDHTGEVYSLDLSKLR